MELLVLLVVTVFWAVCLLVPAATYGLILIDIVKFLIPRKELRRRVIIGMVVFGLVLGAVWLWNYQMSMVLFTVPLLLAPPVRLVLLILSKVKSKGKWEKIEVAKAGGLGAVSLFGVTLLVIITMVFLNTIAPTVFPRLPFGPTQYEVGPTGKSTG